jgi:hypothetical protein
LIDISCKKDLNDESGTHFVDNIIGAVLAALRAFKLAKLLED